MSDWFEVIERWNDERGVREAIVFAGPAQACEDYVHSLGDYGQGLIIRPITF